MTATPTHGRKALADDELLALARAVPEPLLSDDRREEMRTAFLSTVRGLRSGARVQVAAAGRRRRLLFLGVIVTVACAGAAAAAWHVHHLHSRELPRQTAVGSRALTHPPQGSAPVLHSFPPERQPSPATEATRSASANHSRRVSLARAKVLEYRDGDIAVEVAFARGWTALRTGDFNTAAEWFARAAARQPNPLGEDAMFWQGVALDRAGRFEVAHRVLSDFLTRYPDSDRKGEASVILGWLFVRSGDFGAARRYFEGALDDPAERVRKSARSGLVATEGHFRGATTGDPRLP